VKNLRRLYGRLFGFHQEIQELEKRVQELSWDEPFGMWTRGAFLQFCRVMPRGERVVVFIDLDDIHDKNILLGYGEVDKRIKAAFDIPMRRSDIVARWYSGDEIVVLFDSDRAGAIKKVQEIRSNAAAQGLSFRYEIGTWRVGVESIVDAVGNLSDKSRKGSRSRLRKSRS
jgi:GGDEF domain-containing protein